MPGTARALKAASASGLSAATSYSVMRSLVPRRRVRTKSSVSTWSSTTRWSASEISRRVPASLFASSTRLATLTTSPIAVSRSWPSVPTEPSSASP